MNRVARVIASVLLMASVAGAAQPLIVQGVREIGVSGAMGDDGDSLGLSLNGRYGYFVVDGIEIGPYAGLAARDNGDDTLSLGVFGEYNFDMGGSLIPHTGLGCSMGWSDRGKVHDSYGEFEAWGGAKYFFIDYAALGVDVVLSYATKEIYNGYEDSIDWAVRLNTRWYF